MHNYRSKKLRPWGLQPQLFSVHPYHQHYWFTILIREAKKWFPISSFPHIHSRKIHGKFSNSLFYETQWSLERSKASVILTDEEQEYAKNIFFSCLRFHKLLQNCFYMSQFFLKISRSLIVSSGHNLQSEDYSTFPISYRLDFTSFSGILFSET